MGRTTVPCVPAGTLERTLLARLVGAGSIPDRGATFAVSAADTGLTGRIVTPGAAVIKTAVATRCRCRRGSIGGQRSARATRAALHLCFAGARRVPEIRAAFGIAPADASLACGNVAPGTAVGAAARSAGRRSRRWRYVAVTGAGTGRIGGVCHADIVPAVIRHATQRVSIADASLAPDIVAPRSGVLRTAAARRRRRRLSQPSPW